MDVNGSRFELLLGRDDWARCTDAAGNALGALWDGAVTGAGAPVDWEVERSELTLRPDVFRFVAAPLDSPPLPADRRGADRDRHGSWYWIDDDGASLLVQSAGTGATTRFWPVDPPAAPRAHGGSFGPAREDAPPAPRRLSGAAVTSDHYLVVGTLDPPGLLVFDLQGGGAPTHYPWPEEIGFAPFDMAARPSGGVFILDAERARAWELDGGLQIVPAAQPVAPDPVPGAFEPLDSPPAAPSSATIAVASATDATPLGGTPIAIEAAPGGGMLVLDRGDAQGSAVTLYREGVAVGAAARTEDAALALRVTAHDMALAGDVLFVADAGGNQSYAFELAIGADGVTLALLRGHYPMRRYGGKAIVATADGPFYDFGDAWIPLVGQPRARYAEAGEIVSPVLDAGEPSCVWHRVMLDVRVPRGGSIAVWSAAADEPDELALAAWQREPDPLARRGGSELPFVDNGPYDTHELLLQAATGRYLRLRLALRGDGRATPRVRALRVWHERFSYREHYLPAVYGEDAESASFLDRFLANIEGFYTSIEDRLAAAQVLFGADTAPAETLDWLAGWFDLALDPLWDERRRRLLLRNTAQFFRARGTARGIELMLRLTLDPCVGEDLFEEERRPPALAVPRIIESFRTRSSPGVALGDPTDVAAGGDAGIGGEPSPGIRARRWRPGDGRQALADGWAEQLASAGLDPEPFALSEPPGATGAVWRSYASAALGFVPARVDPVRWRAFLGRRYRDAARLASAWGTTAAADDPPRELPADGAPLRDWYAYASLVAPMVATAHRFSVLLPWPLHVVDSSGAELGPEALRALATRIVELQKPAHTTFAVRFFWAAFRVGEARLGADTLLAGSSRVPELVRPAVLGRDHLGETILAGPVASDRVRRTLPPAGPEGPPTAEESS